MLHLIVGHPHRTHPSHAQGEFHGGPGLSANFAARVVVGSLALRSPRHAVALRLDGEGEMDQDLTNQGIQMDLGCFNHPMDGSYPPEILDTHQDKGLVMWAYAAW